jgi:hypothetical protein
MTMMHKMIICHEVNDEHHETPPPPPPQEGECKL